MVGTIAAACLLAAAAIAPAPRTAAAPTTPTGRPLRLDPATTADGISTEPGIKGALDRFQARRRPTAFVVGVIRKFGDDQAGKLAALIAYYGFFSLFPALLALTTVLGFALEGNQSLRNDLRNSALGQFPVIGDNIGGAGQQLGGSTIALVIGLLGALWAGMGAVQAAQDAMNNVWDVPRADAPSFLVKRLRSLLVLLLIVVPLLANVVVPALVDSVTSGVLSWIGFVAGSFVVDVFVFAVAFRLLTAIELTWRTVMPGACVAAAGYVLLQSLGTLYVDHVVTGAEATYGTFGVVIGLLSWMFLLGRIVVFAAEVNVVRARSLWPRSLFGEPTTVSDQRSQVAQAEEAKMSDQAHVAVEFEPAAGSAPT